MSIADELRKEANKADWVHCTTLRDIADRIDAEHEAQLNDAFETRNSDENLESDGWIRLPRDADNVPWNPGDRDEDGNVITHLMLTSSGWHLIMDGIIAHRPERRRHYHAPTVEDVLLEACKAYHGLMTESMSDVAHDMPAPSEIIAEYAAKLRLAEEEDA